MKTKSSTATTTSLDRTFASAERDMQRKLAALTDLRKRIESLEAQKQELIDQMKKVATGETPIAKSISAPSGGTRERVAARGILTFAVINAFKTPKQKLTVDEVIERVSDMSFVKGVPDLNSRVYNMLNSNKRRFERVGTQQFRLAEKPTDALFRRLKQEYASA